MKTTLKIRNIKFIISKKKLLIGVLGLVAVFSVGTVASGYYSQKVTKGISESILRLHVVANSDSEEDQAVKKEIRDDILVYMKDNMKNESSLAEAKSFINEHLGEIEKIAQSKLNQKGLPYGARAVLGDFNFPTKVYGDVAIPAGNYQALRVVLGEGSGANWWCVLFPPLCFVDATHGTVPDSVKSDLKEVLTDEEYAIITTADNEDDIPIKLKFKLVEFFEDGKMQFSGMLKKLFNI